MADDRITKNGLIDAIRKDEVVEDPKVIAPVVDALFKHMQDCLGKGQTVELRGFGIFETRFRKSRNTARNPKTGEQLEIAAHYVVTFRSGQELRNAIKALPLPQEESN